MVTPSVKIQEKERMLRDQNGKEKAHYRKEKSKMEREIFHYSNCEAFLDIKAIARVSLDSDHRNGDYASLTQYFESLNAHEN